MIKLVLSVFFVIHGYIGLERELLVNEAFSFAGILLAAGYFLNRRGLVSKLELSWLLLFLYGLLSFVFFGLIGNSEANLYSQLRTLPVWYSMGCFFFGFYIVSGEDLNFKGSRFFIVASMFLGGKLSPPAMLAVCSAFKLGGDFRRQLVLLASFIIIMSTFKYMLGNHDGTTTVFLFLTFLFFVYLFDKRFFSWMRGNGVYNCAALGFCLFVLFLNWVYLDFSDFYYVGFEYFGDGVDVNSLWRLMFWAKAVGDLQGLENFFGIGLGTPLFDAHSLTSSFINASEGGVEDRSYVLGLHNSFLTVLVRLGPVYLFLVFYILRSILKDLSAIGTYASKLLLIANVLMCIAACFNVVLESSLYAGFFWALLGVSYRYIMEFKLSSVHSSSYEKVGVK